MIKDFDEPVKGVQAWTNPDGFRVCRLHWSADPRKTDAWADEFSRMFPGGRHGSAWREEMEIDFHARAGRPVYPDFNLQTHVIQPFTIPAHCPRFRTIDPGWHNPTACLWVALVDECLTVYREHYQSRLNIEKTASAIKGMTGRDTIEYTVIDPAAYETNMHAQRSIAEQFAEHGIFCIGSNNDVEAGIQAVASLIATNDLGEPRLKVFANCYNTIREFQGYRYMELSDAQKQIANEKEKPIKKDDHAMDALRYLVMNVSDRYLQQYGMQAPGSRYGERAMSLSELALADVKYQMNNPSDGLDYGSDEE